MKVARHPYLPNARCMLSLLGITPNVIHIFHDPRTILLVFISLFSRSLSNLLNPLSIEEVLYLECVAIALLYNWWKGTSSSIQTTFHMYLTNWRENWKILKKKRFFTHKSIYFICFCSRFYYFFAVVVLDIGSAAIRHHFSLGFKFFVTFPITFTNYAHTKIQLIELQTKNKATVTQNEVAEAAVKFIKQSL